MSLSVYDTYSGPDPIETVSDGRGAGTQGELTFAHRLGIPVYLICGMPVAEISGWLLGCATEVFESFEGFHEFMIASLASTIAAET